MVADEPLERLLDTVGRYWSGRAGDGDSTDEADGAGLRSRVDVDGQRRFYLGRTDSNGEDVSVPLENVVSAAIWRETDLDRREVPDVQAAVDEDRLAAVADGDRGNATLRVQDYRVTVSGDGVVDVETRTSVGRRSVLKAAAAVGVTGVTGLGIGGVLEDETDPVPAFGYGGALVQGTTTEASTATPATDEDAVAGGTTTAVATVTETMTATATETTTASTDAATDTDTHTDTPSDTPTETPPATATDVPADVSIEPSGDTSVETGGATETGTPTETEGAAETETDTYGVQRYSEYGYGGFA